MKRNDAETPGFTSEFVNFFYPTIQFKIETPKKNIGKAQTLMPHASIVDERMGLGLSMLFYRTAEMFLPFSTPFMQHRFCEPFAV